MKRSLVTLCFVLLVTTATLADDWPQWRGPRRDGIATETGLLQEWPKEGPKLRWQATDIGSGYSSPAIAGGRVYLQTTNGDEEVALALDERTGKQVWSAPIGKVGENRGPQYPGTRSTPTVDGNLIYCLASDGELVCLEAAAGKLVWSKHLQRDLGGEPGNWAYSESLLVDGDALICTPGGSTATLAALDKKTGEVIWKSAVPGGDNAEYASIMIADVNGQKQYVQFLRKGLVGVDAKSGKFLWRYDKTVDRGANILTPIVTGSRVFSSGSRTGGGLVELRSTGDSVTAQEIFFDRALGASIGGAVLVKEQLYGTGGQALFCADISTGKVLWSERAVGPASICFADGRLYLRGYSSGDIALVEPSPEGYREMGRFKQPDRSDTPAWPHPVVANAGLYLRDQGLLLCYDIAR